MAKVRLYSSAPGSGKNGIYVIVYDANNKNWKKKKYWQHIHTTLRLCILTRLYANMILEVKGFRHALQTDIKLFNDTESYINIKYLYLKSIHFM